MATEKEDQVFDDLLEKAKGVNSVRSQRFSMPKIFQSEGQATKVPVVRIVLVGLILVVLGYLAISGKRPGFSKGSSDPLFSGNIAVINNETAIKSFAIKFVQTVFTVSYNSYDQARAEAEKMMTPGHAADYQAVMYDVGFWKKLDDLKAQVSFEMKDNPGLRLETTRDGKQTYVVTVQGILRLYSLRKQNFNILPLNLAVHVIEQEDGNLKVSHLLTNE